MQAHIILYSIAGLSIILGFIALLKQKTYLDPKTNEPTSVEISNIGKMKSNYPALVFAFLGFALAVIAMLNRDVPVVPKPGKVNWTIQGTIKNPKFDSITDYSDFTVELAEPEIECEVGSDGKYKIKLQLDSGQSLESKYDRLEFSAGNEKIVNIDPIYLRDELSNFKKGLKSKLRKVDTNYRRYDYPNQTADQ
jgi:hypothetical protein